ncbi:MAG: DUF1273 domain-containing protein [Clostridia bacterium]|nr:DUF1273 domain-containing protein [Clostridia bacterium]
MNINNTVAFTGHRVISEPVDEENLISIIKELIKGGAETFLCGMAMGFDLIAAEAVLKIKRETPHIKLIACVPCPDQKNSFKWEEKAKYDRIIAQCDEVKILSDHYYDGCMLARNRYMVDNSYAVIAYKRSNLGGTVYTLKYANERGKKIIFI